MVCEVGGSAISACAVAALFCSSISSHRIALRRPAACSVQDLHPPPPAPGLSSAHRCRLRSTSSAPPLTRPSVRPLVGLLALPNPLPRLRPPSRSSSKLTAYQRAVPSTCDGTVQGRSHRGAANPHCAQPLYGLKYNLIGMCAGEQQVPAPPITVMVVTGHDGEG